MAQGVIKPALAAACAALLLAVAAALAAPRPGGGGSQVTSAKIKNGTIRNLDIATNAITGSRIDEGTLKRVPDAEAIGGNQVDLINHHAQRGGAAVKILDLGGLQMNASCSPTAVLSLEAGTSLPGSVLLSSTTDASDGVSENAVYQTSMPSSGNVQLLPDDDAPQIGSLRFLGTGGQVVTVEYATVADCVVTGHALFG